MQNRIRVIRGDIGDICYNPDNGKLFVFTPLTNKMSSRDYESLEQISDGDAALIRPCFGNYDRLIKLSGLFQCVAYNIRNQKIEGFIAQDNYESRFFDIWENAYYNSFDAPMPFFSATCEDVYPKQEGFTSQRINGRCRYLNSEIIKLKLG